MIKYVAKAKDGKTIVGFGIDAENVKRLMAAMPILVHLKDLGLADIDILIHYGDTQKRIYEDLEEMIGPETTIVGDQP